MNASTTKGGTTFLSACVSVVGLLCGASLPPRLTARGSSRSPHLKPQQPLRYVGLSACLSDCLSVYVKAVHLLRRSLEVRLVQARAHPARHRRGRSLALTNHCAAHGDVGERNPLPRQEGLLLETFFQRSHRSRRATCLFRKQQETNKTQKQDITKRLVNLS